MCSQKGLILVQLYIQLVNSIIKKKALFYNKKKSTSLSIYKFVIKRSPILPKTPFHPP